MPLWVSVPTVWEKTLVMGWALELRTWHRAAPRVRQELVLDFWVFEGGNCTASRDPRLAWSWSALPQAPFRGGVLQVSTSCTADERELTSGVFSLLPGSVLNCPPPRQARGGRGRYPLCLVWKRSRGRTLSTLQLLSLVVTGRQRDAPLAHRTAGSFSTS